MQFLVLAICQNFSITLAVQYGNFCSLGLLFVATVFPLTDAALKQMPHKLEALSEINIALK